MQAAQQSDQAVNFVAQPKAHIGRDLVIARAPSVQPLASVAHELGEACLDVQVHVFQLKLPLETARFDVLGDLRQAALDGREIFGIDEALRRQHVSVGEAARNIRAPQPLVEPHAGRVALHQNIHRFSKKGRPALGFGIEL